ncbi:hybrid sensor histidine kinase/response regulator [Desulforhopalus sp. 52FAK]
MKLHFKIILTIVPLVLIIILGLGFWSYGTARKNSIDSLFQFIETSLEVHFLAELEQKVHLLQDSKMDGVDYFVDHYKQEVLTKFKADAQRIEGSHIFIFSHTGKMIFSSAQQKSKDMENAWSDIAIKTATTGHTTGHFTTAPFQSYFAAHLFPSWEWIVFFSLEDKELHQYLQKMRLTTIIVAIVAGISIVFILFIIFRQILIRPIQQLQLAASQIARQQPSPQLNTSAKDELGQLAREMKGMADAITSYNEEQLRLQNELRQSNLSLQESEDKFRRAILMAPFPVMIHAEDGEVLQINHSWTELTGYTHEEISQMSDWLEKAYGQRSADIANAIAALYNLESKTDEGEFEIRTVEGKQIYWDFSSAPLGKEKNGRRLVISMAKDVTESKNSANEKRMLEQKLIQSQKMESIGNLAGGIAHDFNNILSVIIGYAELAIDETERGSSLDESLQEIYTAGNRARDLVKQILAFARQSGEEKKPLQLSTILKEVIKFIRSTIPTSVEIHSSIESSAFILGNPTQVHQVLMNLCTNAAQAMSADDSGVLEVQLTEIDLDLNNRWQKLHLEPGKYIELSISDTGQGIAPQNIESIFEPYFTTKKVGEGTGMGLAMAKGIVESYNGAITVESNLGKGSTFTIYLPVSTHKQWRDTSKEKQLPGGSEHILFVDDEPAIAKMGVRILESLGYSVVSKTNSKEALEFFQNHPEQFDLLITDMTMPHMTGDKLASEVLRIRPDIPVIICTGYSNRISPEQAQQIGINGFAYKPLSKADLAVTVRRSLDASTADYHVKS